MKLLLLPGMDGTGELFSDLRDTLAGESEPVVIRYPSNKELSFYELAELVQKCFPVEEPFVIIAESFSVPVAVICAAKKPANLKETLNNSTISYLNPKIFQIQKSG